MFWSLHWLYPYALTLTAFVAVGGSRRLQINVAAIAFDWLILSHVGDQISVLLNTAVDVVAAELSLIALCNRFSKLVLLTWALMLATHALGGLGWLDALQYWKVLLVLATAQLGVCFAWGGYDGGRRIRLGYVRHLRGNHLRSAFVRKNGAGGMLQRADGGLDAC